ncbi:MAG: type II toxin-antitoxin system HicA family toxin [Candidatus Brocadiae bacterium]|nr:type II toxin-antitoxin system HicA family toxin [Candidatus Brocadiia bacterium]
MPPRYSSDEVIRALSRVGIQPVRQRGSHVRLRGVFRGGTRHVTVPTGQANLHPKTLSTILRQAGLTREELARLAEGADIGSP